MVVFFSRRAAATSAVQSSSLRRILPWFLHYLESLMRDAYMKLLELHTSRTLNNLHRKLVDVKWCCPVPIATIVSLRLFRILQ
jgi:hypothetical protein